MTWGGTGQSDGAGSGTSSDWESGWEKCKRYLWYTLSTREHGLV